MVEPGWVWAGPLLTTIQVAFLVSTAFPPRTLDFLVAFKTVTGFSK